MPGKCKDCCSRLFCMAVAEVSGEDFATMADKKDCRKRVFTNADRIRAMSDEELAEWMAECNAYGERADASQWLPWLKQPAE